MERLLFLRYPAREWGTFFRFGFRRTSWGLAACFASPERPNPGDLDRSSPVTVFRSRYILRAHHIVEDCPLAAGVIHSHPEGFDAFPSPSDDDMDTYFGQEFCKYGKGKPYVSLIFSRDSDCGFRFTGRVYDNSEWYPVAALLTVGDELSREEAQKRPFERFQTNGAEPSTDSHESTTARLETLLGRAASRRLSMAKVAVIGCSGTGSPVAHLLARAGVQDCVLVDPQWFAPSNLERMHGSRLEDALTASAATKVEIVARLIHEINPAARIECIQGNMLDEFVLDKLLQCDLVLGCTDSQHGRAALGDLAAHYLLPSIDIAVTMRAKAGKLRVQLVEVCRHAPQLPCPFCLGRIDQNALEYELMTEEERKWRKEVADAAVAQGIDGAQYWGGEPPQELTVGYLTSLAGSMAAGYAENMLTGAAQMPHQRFQFDVGWTHLGVVAAERPRNPDCSCGKTIGFADQAKADRSVSMPAHWPRALLVQTQRPEH
ncbi:MAG: HesA/MoeB/ThiF family protein [Limisphaerales bacterium]